MASMDSSDSPGSAQGTLRLHQGVGLLVSGLLGSGVFIVPAMVAALAGSYAWLAWALMSLLMMPVILTFAALGKSWPHAAGTAFFVRQAFGPRAERLIGWLFLSVIPIGPPVVVITGASYLAFCLGLGSEWTLQLSLLMLALLLLLGSFNVKLSGHLQFAITLLTSLVLLSVIAAVVITGPVAEPVPDPLHLAGQHSESLSAAVLDGSLLSAMGLIFWCFVGIEAAAHIAPEFRHPERDFPRTVLLSLLLAIVLYSLLSMAVLHAGAFGSETQNLASLPGIIAQWLGRPGAAVIGLIGFLTCLGATNLYLLSFTRLMIAMSQQGQLSSRLAQTNRFHSPVLAVVVTLLLITLTVVLKLGLGLELASLIGYANGVFVLIYLAAALAATRLLPGRQRTVAVLASLVCLLICLMIGFEVFYALGALGLLSLIRYWRRLRSRRLAVAG